MEFQQDLIQTQGRFAFKIFTKKCMVMGTYCLRAILYVVKITIFEFLYFTEFASGPYKTLHVF